MARLPYPSDPMRDGMHDLLIEDVRLAEAKLAEQGKTPLFRIASYTDKDYNSPPVGWLIDELNCIPGNTDPPPTTGTTDLQLFGHIMVLAWPGMFGGRYYPEVRAGQPSAVQYSIDAGLSWLWASDVIGKTVPSSKPITEG